MKGCVASSLFTVAAAHNLFNAKLNGCMDIERQCVDGTNRPDCQLQDTHTDNLQGANLKLWDCANWDSQVFEIYGGRLRNVETGLCLDIDLKVDSHVQLWSCHSSDRYGDQTWDFMDDGRVKNVGSGLCLTAESGHSLYVHTCGSPLQYFDFVDAPYQADVPHQTDAPAQVAPGQPMAVTVTVGQGSAPAQVDVVQGYSSVQVIHPGYIVGSLGFIVAAVALIATRMRTPVLKEVESVALISE
jgi:hypothetical protein